MNLRFRSTELPIYRLLFNKLVHMYITDLPLLSSKILNLSISALDYFRALFELYDTVEYDLPQTLIKPSPRELVPLQFGFKAPQRTSFLFLETI